MMATTLSYGATTLTLDESLLWPDEFDWQGVEQESEYTITGALVVQSRSKQAGRRITLQGGTDYGWLYRTTLLTLQTWQLLPGIEMTLVYRGTSYNVAFDQANRAIEATPIVDYSDPAASCFYAVTLRFIEV